MNSQQTDEPLIERNVPLAEHTTFKCGVRGLRRDTSFATGTSRRSRGFAR
jgi:hypothetical protein